MKDTIFKMVKDNEVSHFAFENSKPLKTGVTQTIIKESFKYGFLGLVMTKDRVILMSPACGQHINQLSLSLTDALRY